MSYHQLFYHIVWATYNREPMITPEIERVVQNYIRAKAVGLGAMVFAVNGMPDHVHVVASIPPTIAVSKFIGQIKGASSVKINQSGDLTNCFGWQDKYGAFTFGKKRLPNIVEYVERQKEHHADNTVIPILERVADSGTIS